MKKNLDNNELKNINIIRDIPISDKDKLETSFGYDIYAQKLFQIIKSNSGPLSIGLLGPWGYGKSTILEIFKKEIQNDSNSKVIYFNSWKYSNDSFRRQLLIEFAAGVYEGNKLSKIINNLNIRFFQDLDKGIKINTNRYFRFLLVVFIILIIVGIYIPKESNWILQSVGLFSYMAIFLKVFSEKLFNNVIKLDIDPKITLPEHFESEFKKILDDCRNKNLIFIIDDIDRCRPETVLEILDSSKTFLASHNAKEDYNNVYFIFAMDDFAVRSILTEYRNKSYEIEDIVKFFDVIVRINPINDNDLLEYAKSLIKELKLNEKILDIIFYADFDTPRKIKHFINSYSITLEIARERQKKGLFNVEEKDLDLIIAKMLAIQMIYPEFLHDIGNKIPYIIKDFELGKSFAKEKLEKHNIFLNQEDIPKLSKVSTFIAKTNYLSPIIDFESFINLKIPKYATNFGLEYSALKNSILYFDEKKLEEINILKQIDSTNAIKNSIIEMFKSLIDNSFYSSDVKKNIFKSLIFINKKIDLGYDLDFIKFVVENAKNQNILNFLELEPETLFRWCEKINKNKNNLIDKFLGVEYANLDELKKTNFISLINLIYKDDKLLDKYAENINLKIKKMNKEVQIDILSSISPIDFDKCNKKVPGEDVLNLLFENNRKDIFNENFLDIIFKFWYPSFNLKITELILDKIIEVQNISDKEVDNIFYAIVKIYEIDKALKPKTTISPQQRDQIIAFLKQNKNRESEKLIKALVIFSKSLNLDINILKEFIFSLNEDTFKYLLEFLYENKKDNKLNEYYKNILYDIFSFAVFNGKNITQKYFFSLPDFVLNEEENKIKSFINNIFSASNLYLKNVDYLMYVPKIIRKIGSIDKYKKEVLDKILITIKFNNNNFDIKTKQELIKVYIDIVDNNFRFEDEEFANIILSYLKSGNPYYIQLGLSYVIEMKKAYEKSNINFKVIVADILKYITQINNFIPEIKNLLIKLLDFKDDFDEKNSKLLVEILDNLRIKNEYGLLVAIIEKLEKRHIELIPEEWDKFKQSIKLISDNDLKIKIDNIISQKEL